MRFAWKVFLCVLLVTVIALSATTYFLTRAAFETALAQEKQKSLDRMRMLAVVVESMAAGYSFSSDEAELQGVMRSAATGDFSSARLYAADGRAIYGGSPGGPPGGPSDELFEGAKTGISHTILEENGAYSMHMLMPVQLGVKTGTLYLAADVTAPFSLSGDMMQKAMLLTLAATLAVGALLLPVSNLLTKPVRSLSEITRAFSKGDYARRASVSTSDEIGELTRDFNSMADALEEHMRELALQARRREDFVTGFAHELKTPLTSIIGYADTLRSRALTEEERFYSANYIFTEGRRLERLSFKLLELMVLNRREFPLHPLETRDVEERLRAMLDKSLPEKYGVTLLCELPEATLRTEADLLQTMLVNLLDNAAKASRPGQTVRVAGRRCPAGYRIDVVDEGIGIAKAELERVTEAFYMADKSRSRAQNGAGMGLALCDAIAKVLGAQLHIQSEPGKGTDVFMLLPYGEDDREAGGEADEE